VPFGAVAWVIASAFLHAGWNALVRREAQARAATIVVLTLATLGAIAACVVGGEPWMPAPALKWALGSAFCEGLYVIGLARALEAAPLGLAYSVSRGTGLLWVWPLSVVFQHEPVSLLGAVASSLVLFGVVAAGSRPGELRFSGGFGWALLAGVGGGFSNPCIRQALVEGAPPMQVFALSLGVGLIPAIGTLGVGAAALVGLARSRWQPLLAGGVLCFGSYAMFLVALRVEGAAHATTLRNSSIVFALLLSWALGEVPTLRQWGGTAAVLAGAAVLAIT
jgi:drug/metabolite transporter (DMT)-like permease